MSFTINLPAAIAQMNADFDFSYKKAFEQTQPWSDPVVTTVSTSNVAFTLGGLAQFPNMRKWLGQKQIKRLQTMTFTATADDYEATIEVPKNDVLGDNLGQYQGIMEGLGATGKKLQDQLVASTLQNGKSAATGDVGFDALAIFSNAHTLDPAGTQSNLLTTSPLNSGSFNTAYETMLAYKGNESQPLGVQPNIVLVPPQLRGEAVELFKNANQANGATNANQNIVDFYVIPELAGESTVWYLLGTKAGIKPFQYYVFEAPNLVSQTNPDSDTVFFDRMFLYSCHATVKMIIPFWFLIIRCES